MRKEMTSIKNFIFKSIVAGLIFTTTFTVIPPAVYAEDELSALGIARFAVESIMHFQNKEANPIVAMPGTVTGALLSMGTNSLSMVMFGMNADDLSTCGASYLNDLAGGNKDGFSVNSSVLDALDPEFRDSLGEASTQAAVIGCESVGKPGSLSKGSGSMMALAKQAFDVSTSDPLPVNLAHYAKHNLQKIPIVGDTAYAQTSYPGAWGLELALSLWESSRNLAYALMAIIMLIIGIMIILRREIGRSYVTVQTAIPRVVISLVLITFSYPIGAIMASFVTFLIVAIMQLFFGTLAVDGNILNLQVFMAFFPLLVAVPAPILGGVGFMSLMVAILLLGITLLAILVALIKMMFVYLKILIHIIFAPIQFAFAAVPGQEEIITTWFKKMASLVLAIPAMFFYIALGWFIIAKPLSDPVILTALMTKPSALGAGTFFFRSLASGVFTVAMLPVLAVMTMFSALKADKAIEEAIMGSKKR